MVKRVFLLDDDDDEHEIFQSALHRINSNVAFSAASTWQQAALQLKNFDPHFIFVDLNMPKMDGFSCIVEIRKIKPLQQTPVFIYSTGITEREGKRAIVYGATNYIVKPASFIDLCRLLRKIIDS